ncbi:hypothetical protein TPA0909_48840 [Streptomyces albus]|nr:hypothetical protein TPA0909_48840 [Streptomyces albus]
MRSAHEWAERPGAVPSQAPYGSGPRPTRPYQPHPRQPYPPPYQGSRTTRTVSHPRSSYTARQHTP